jgi:hypothetical protein
MLHDGRGLRRNEMRMRSVFRGVNVPERCANPKREGAAGKIVAAAPGISRCRKTKRRYLPLLLLAGRLSRGNSIGLAFCIRSAVQ